MKPTRERKRRKPDPEHVAALVTCSSEPTSSGVQDGIITVSIDDEDKEPTLPASAALGESRRATNQQTAKLAGEILRDSALGFVIPTARQREAILVAFVRAGFIVYGKAFDVVRAEGAIDLEDEHDIRKNINSVVLYEIKSTSKKTGSADFRRHFFSLSTAELLVAQNLGKRYRFVFVNTHTRAFVEMTLQEVLARARGIYPMWAIQF